MLGLALASRGKEPDTRKAEQRRSLVLTVGANTRTMHREYKVCATRRVREHDHEARLNGNSNYHVRATTGGLERVTNSWLFEVDERCSHRWFVRYGWGVVGAQGATAPLKALREKGDESIAFGWREALETRCEG